MSYFGIPKITLGGLEQVPVSLASENIVIDTNNTYTGTIAAGATKSDLPGSEVTPITSIQVYFSADQNCTIYVDQADSLVNLGTAGSIIDTLNYYPSLGNGSMVITSAAPYFRVRVKNLNASTQANVILITAVTPLLPTLPRTLCEHGHLQVAVQHIKDILGLSALNTPQGELRTIIPTRIVGAQFDMVGSGSVPDSNFWSTYVDATAGPGSITVANSSCQIHSGTNAASYGKLLSIKRARYIGAHALRFRSNIIMQNTQSNNTKRWGVAYHSNYVFTNTSATVTNGDVYSNNTQFFTVLKDMAPGTTLTAHGTGAPTASGTLTKVSGASTSPATIAYSAITSIVNPQNGAWFKLTGSTLSLETCMGGTATPITSFNGTLGSSYTLDTNNHTYEIYWTNFKIYFTIDGLLLHTYTTTNTVWTSTLHLHIYIDNVNSGNTTDTYFEVRNAIIHRMGPNALDTNPSWKNIRGQTTGTVLKYGPGILRRVIFNTPSATTSGISMYDSIYGAYNVIALIVNTFGNQGMPPYSLDYDLSFYNGLYVVTPNISGQDLTIVYD
jgi:hypothetical protein